MSIVKIGMIGACGRMGRQIVAEIVADSATQLSAAVDHAKSEFLGQDMGPLAGCVVQKVVVNSDVDAAVQASDVVIDFSSLEALSANLDAVVKHNKAIVMGTTGLDDSHKALLQKASQKVPCLWSPNMSVGVNLLFKIVGEVAKMLGDDYDLEIVEKHHNQKKDAPSGTAVALAEVIAEATGRSYADDVVHGREGLTGARSKREIGMHAVRGGGIVGEHTVIYAGEADSIEITHKAQSRRAFALGAVRGAKWLAGQKPGLYSLLDVLSGH